MTNTPSWNQMALTSLPADDEAEARYNTAADNLLAALFHAIQAFERNDMPDLADRLGGAFLQAFGTKGLENPEPRSDDPEEQEELRRIAAIETPEEAARYLVSKGFNELDAADFVFSLLQAVRREL